MATSATPPSKKVSLMLQVKIKVAEKDIETFLAHFKPAYDAVLAESECAYFFVGQDGKEPGVFRWTEGWTEGIDWFWAVQSKKSYYEPYLRATEPLFIERIIEAYTPTDGLNNVKVDFFKAAA